MCGHKSKCLCYYDCLKLPPFSVLEKNGTQHTELQKTVRDFVSKTLNVT